MAQQDKTWIRFQDLKKGQKIMSPHWNNGIPVKVIEVRVNAVILQQPQYEGKQLLKWTFNLLEFNSTKAV